MFLSGYNIIIIIVNLKEEAMEIQIFVYEIHFNQKKINYLNLLDLKLQIYYQLKE